MNVLHVDDDGGHRLYIGHLLESLASAHTIEVRQAEDAAEAEALLDGWLIPDGGPGVVFCDHMMPGRTGARFMMDVIERVPPRIRLYFLTGYLHDPDIQAALDAGVAGALDKGFDMDDLRERLAEAIVAVAKV